MIRMEEVALAGRKVMIRVDMNTPLQDGRVADDRRIRACLPTIQTALGAGAAVILVSHLGRPDEGKFDARFSLRPVAEKLSELLGRAVPLLDDYLNGVDVACGAVAMCENVRFQPGETGDDAGLAARLARLCDVFVMDAFGCAHRAHASTHGVAQRAEVACAGPLLCSEIEHLQKVLEWMQTGRSGKAGAGLRVAVIGGAKVSGKMELLESFTGKLDALIVGGGIANTFLAARGHPVGGSLYEPGLVEFAKKYEAQARRCGMRLVLPSDVVCAGSLSAAATPVVKPPHEVGGGDLILDAGPDTVAEIGEVLSKAGVILWNGPLGAFECEPFSSGTRELARMIGRSPGLCVAGGGDTLLAIDRFGCDDGAPLARRLVEKGGYVSTGGGSFIEFIQGKPLPAIEALERRAAA